MSNNVWKGPLGNNTRVRYFVAKSCLEGLILQKSRNVCFEWEECSSWFEVKQTCGGKNASWFMVTLSWLLKLCTTTWWSTSVTFCSLPFPDASAGGVWRVFFGMFRNVFCRQILVSERWRHVTLLVQVLPIRPHTSAGCVRARQVLFRGNRGF